MAWLTALLEFINSSQLAFTSLLSPFRRVERHVLFSYANESTLCLCRTFKVQYDVHVNDDDSDDGDVGDDDDEAVAFWHCHAVKRNQTPIRAIKMKIGCEVATQHNKCNNG